MRLGIAYTFAQYLINCRRNGALFLRQQTVAAAFGQAVGVTDNRTFDYLHIAIDIFRKLLDNGNLLPILLSEISAVRSDNIKQTTHNLTHSVEMAGAACPFHDHRHGRKLKMAGVGTGIYILDGRSKYVICAASLDQTAIGLKRPWVTVEIALVIKLSRVQENRNHRYIIFSDTLRYQRGMPLMQRSHRWHQTNLLALFSRKEKRILQINNLIKDFHFLSPIGAAK